MIVVDGTSIQAAIDAAQPGDELDVRAGGYAGFRVTKPLTIIGGDGVRVEGPGHTVQVSAPGVTLEDMNIGGSTGVNNSCVFSNVNDTTIRHCEIGPSECYGIRSYQADRLSVVMTQISHVAAGVEVHRRGAGSRFLDVAIRDVNRMVIDAPPGANGGDAYQFYNTDGPVLVSGGILERLRAPSTVYPPADGGAFNIFGGVADLTIEDLVIRDAVNVMETGKNAADGQPTRVTMRRVKVEAAGTGVCAGFLIRCGIDFTVEDSEFRGLDWWVIDLEPGGRFGGVVSGFSFLRNNVWLGEGQAYYLALPNDVIKQIDGNQIYYPASRPGYVSDVRGVITNNLPAWRGLTGQAAPNEYWGPEATPDPCQSVKDELAVAKLARDGALAEEARLADINSRALAALNTRKVSQTTRIHRAKAILTEG